MLMLPEHLDVIARQVVSDCNDKFACLRIIAMSTVFAEEDFADCTPYQVQLARDVSFKTRPALTQALAVSLVRRFNDWLWVSRGSLAFLARYDCADDGLSSPSSTATSPDTSAETASRCDRQLMSLTTSFQIKKR